MIINNSEYEVIKQLSSGASSVEKYIAVKDNKRYLIRLYDIRFMSSRYEAFKNIELLYNAGIHVPKLYDYGKKDDTHGYGIFEWIDGISLDKLLVTDEDAIKYGALASRELTKMHDFKVNIDYDIYAGFMLDFNKKIEKVRRLIPNFKSHSMEQYVLNNAGILKQYTAGIVHGDFHPGNIIVNGDKIYLIDLDVCHIDFPWVDLATNACNMDYPNFYTVVINEYFKGNISDEFWIVYKLYGILYCLDYILYCNWIDDKTIYDGCKVLEQFLEYSDDFSLDKPKWFNNKVLRKEK